MNGITRSMCTFDDVRTDDKAKDHCRRLRLTLHEQNQQHRTPAQPRSKPIGRAFALVQPSSERQPVKFDSIRPTEEKVEIIKVYLEGRKKEQARDQQNLKMLTDEVSQIQEVRYCLKTLREVMAARNNNNNGEQKFPPNGYTVHVASSQPPASSQKDDSAAAEEQDWEDEQESARLREVSKRLYGQLQEAERRHQEDRERLQAESGQYRQQLSEQGERLVRAEEGVESRDRRIEELQRLLSGMQQESAALQEKMRNSEEELLHLREHKEESQRSEQLEKELAIMKEKIHHLDDMLKSQQRKVRHMIEQLENSRTVIQERDHMIRELEERVAYLEAENRELHDQMDYFLGGQRPNANQSSAERSPQIVYSSGARKGVATGPLARPLLPFT
ncbi:tuftelin 1a isoform X2 [Conger conger]|uniref:tuftelin 1a isoform X2 n=1 Tax=Conger conger TaxID=82655 RepID=UPI002A5A13D1|nr:tuftelin 1a isoform X2 [Conger conger]XP_061075598.1 tuftelin 1a isoform X2 [Conger conger]